MSRQTGEKILRKKWVSEGGVMYARPFVSLTAVVKGRWWVIPSWVGLQARGDIGVSGKNC